MENHIQRVTFSPLSTIGVWSIEQSPFCDTMELCDRRLEVNGEIAKVAGQTAIPRGRYQIVMAPSAHFQCDMPHLVDVPYFTDIMIHWGSYPKNYLGCIGVGQYDQHTPDYITGTHDTWNELMGKLMPSMTQGNCWVKIE